MSALLDRLRKENPCVGIHRMDPRRKAYVLLYRLRIRKAARLLTDALMDQLDACKSDEARRLILGVPERSSE